MNAPDPASETDAPDDTDASEEVEEVEEDWLAAERSQYTLRSELQRLKRRARRRPIMLAVITTLLVGAVMFKRSRRRPTYEGAVVLRVTESTVLDEMSPLAQEHLGNYFANAGVSSKELMTIIEEYNLYPLRKFQGDRFAIMEIRDAMSIHLADNYFSEYQGFVDTLRTARLSVMFAHGDPETAYQVASDLTDILVRNELARRTEAAESLLAIAARSTKVTEARLVEIQAEIRKTEEAVRVARRTGPKLDLIAKGNVALGRLRPQLKQASGMLEALQIQENAMKVGAAAENAGMGLQFDIVDVDRPRAVPPPTVAGQVMFAIILFLICLPLVAIGVGAFDPKLHHIDDVVRLELPVVGHVPRFPGYRVGSMKDRSRRNKSVA